MTVQQKTSRIMAGGAALIVVLSLAGMRPAAATLIDAIGALKVGDQYRVAFVTSATFNATSTTTGTYNSDVQTVASGGTVTTGLGLAWSAWVSAASTSAVVNTGISPGDTGTVYIFNTRGDVVALSDSGLVSGTLLQPISFDENGRTRSTTVWTGTNADGSAASGDTLGSSVAVYGQSHNIDAAWTDIGIAPDGLPYSLYGLSSLATVTRPKLNAASGLSTPIPEPASVYLVVLGFAELAWRCRRGSKAAAIALRRR